MKSINAALKNSINQIINTKSKARGRLTEIIFDNENDPQYAVIATDNFAGSKVRYFAIPVLPVFIDVAQNGNITFNVNQNDLVLARRVQFEDCPTIKENDFFPSIYEVYGYEAPLPPVKKKAM